MVKAKGLDVEMAEMRKDMEHIKIDFGEFKDSQFKRDKKFDEFLIEFRKHADEEREVLKAALENQDVKNDRKYASKTAEILIYSAVGAVLFIILGVAVNHFLIK